MQEQGFSDLKRRTGKDWINIRWNNPAYPNTPYLCLHDIQNSLCEFRKYWRLKAQEKAKKRYFKVSILTFFQSTAFIINTVVNSDCGGRVDFYRKFAVTALTFSFMLGACGAKPLTPRDEYDLWLKQLKTEMAARGISEKTLRKAFAQDYYHENPEVVKIDRRQPEFDSDFDRLS